MPHTTGNAAICAAGALIAALASPAKAAEDDTQLWTTFALVHKLGEGVDGTFELSPRIRNAAAGNEQVLTRVLVDGRLTSAVTAGGGLTYVDYAGGREIRPHQQVNISAGRLSFRTLLEERFIKGADRMELRLRQRAQMTFPLDKATALSLTGEVLGTARSRRRNGTARIEQWRGNLVVRKKLTPDMTGGLGYLVILTPRVNAPDRISHVLQLAITFRI